MSELERIPTIVYGGAFNPPTLAHEAIIAASLEFARTVDADVWLLPSGDRSDKRIYVERERRLGYLAAMLVDLDAKDSVSIIESELDRNVDVETYDTVMELQEQYPERAFRWVFGADSTHTMGAWKQGAWLLKNLDMLLVERLGSFISSDARNVETLSIPAMDISSTEVRRRMETGEPLDEFVGNAVGQLIGELQKQEMAYL